MTFLKFSKQDRYYLFYHIYDAMLLSYKKNLSYSSPLIKEAKIMVNIKINIPDNI